MTSPSKSNPPPVPDEPTAPSGGGFAALARRLSAWSANLLATGLVLVAGLALGRQVITWWRASPSESTSPRILADVPGRQRPSAVRPWLLEFGDFPVVVHRSTVSGDLEHVLGQLRHACREAAGQGTELAAALRPAERRMLAGLRGLDPVERVAGQWEIYQVEQPIPMTVAVGLKEVEKPGFDEVAAAERRVVCWGLALPVVPQADGDPVQWTLFTYAASGQAALTDDAPRAPVPPDASRTLSLRAASGSALVGFRGSGNARVWAQFYDEHFADGQWQGSPTWDRRGGIWRRRFRHARLGSIDVQLIAAAEKSLSGLLVITPTAGQPRRTN